MERGDNLGEELGDLIMGEERGEERVGDTARGGILIGELGMEGREGAEYAPLKKKNQKKKKERKKCKNKSQNT